MKKEGVLNIEMVLDDKTIIQSLNIFQIFPTFIFMSDVNEIDNNELLAHIYKIKEIDAGVKVSNSNGWQSTSSKETDCEQLFKLKQFIDGMMLQIYQNYGVLRQPTLDNYWYNVNNKYSYNKQHVHPRSYFSAVYYVKTPKDSGELYFNRPDNLLHYIDVDRLTPTNVGEVRSVPKEHELIIFPSYLSHGVNINNSDEERVSIAFNYS